MNDVRDAVPDYSPLNKDKMRTYKIPFIVEISGSHGGEYEDDCLLGCCAVLSGRN
jgi:hypothetical protein